MRSHLLSAVTLTLALTVTGRATEPSTPALVTKSFAVGDLVTPIPDAVLPGAKPGFADRWKRPTVTESAAQLARLVTATVQPASWEKSGGAGMIAFAEAGCALTVTNTPDAVTQVAALLDGMRRVQDVSVCCAVTIVKAPAGFCDRTGLTTTGNAVLTDRQVRAVMEAAQGDRNASVMQAPKVTTFDGQVATIQVAEWLPLVTGIEATRLDGDVVFTPKSSPVLVGDSLTLCGRLSADEKAVTLRANFTRARQTGPVEQVPVTTQITPVFEGGSRGKPIPATQYVQVPRVKTQAVEKAAVVPDGGTIILGGWKEPADDPAGGSRSFLKAFSKGSTKDYEVVVLATVRVIRCPEEVQPSPVNALPVAPLPRASSAD